MVHSRSTTTSVIGARSKRTATMISPRLCTILQEIEAAAVVKLLHPQFFFNVVGKVAYAPRRAGGPSPSPLWRERNFFSIKP